MGCGDLDKDSVATPLSHILGMLPGLWRAETPHNPRSGPWTRSMDAAQFLGSVYRRPMTKHVRTRDARPAGYQFCIRSLDEKVHRRLRAAAEEDNRSMASELWMLLDLREHWKQLTEPDHPLALPLPEVIA